MNCFLLPHVISAQEVFQENFLYGRYIVVLKDIVTKQNDSTNRMQYVEKISARIAAKYHVEIEKRYIHAFLGFTTKTSRDKIEDIRQEPYVEYVSIEEDFYTNE